MPAKEGKTGLPDGDQDPASTSRWGYRKKDFVCQEEFDHKIWSGVSVMMEGMYRVGQSSEETGHQQLLIAQSILFPGSKIYRHINPGKQRKMIRGITLF